MPAKEISFPKEASSRGYMQGLDEFIGRPGGFRVETLRQDGDRTGFRPFEVRQVEVRPVEVRPLEVRLGEIRPFKVRPAEMS